MKEKDKELQVNLEQIAVAATLTLEALLKVLENKGLVNTDEVINEIRMIRSVNKLYN